MTDQGLIRAKGRARAKMKRTIYLSPTVVLSFRLSLSLPETSNQSQFCHFFDQFLAAFLVLDSQPQGFKTQSTVLLNANIDKDSNRPVPGTHSEC